MSSTTMLHMYCAICLSVFLRDVGAEAEAVATPCGHVFHRDCIEGLIKVAQTARCHVCSTVLTDGTGSLVKLYLATEESAYDAQILQAVRAATHLDDHSLDAAAAKAECQDKIDTLREEQKYNETMLIALDAEWSAVEALNVNAEERLRVLQVKVTQAEKTIAELEAELRAA